MKKRRTQTTGEPRALSGKSEKYGIQFISVRLTVIHQITISQTNCDKLKLNENCVRLQQQNQLQLPLSFERVLFT